MQVERPIVTDHVVPPFRLRVKTWLEIDVQCLAGVTGTNPVLYITEFSVVGLGGVLRQRLRKIAPAVARRAGQVPGTQPDAPTPTPARGAPSRQ